MEDVVYDFMDLRVSLTGLVKELEEVLDRGVQ